MGERGTNEVKKGKNKFKKGKKIIKQSTGMSVVFEIL